MNYNPSVILKCLSTQSTYINISERQMFYYTDKNQLWYDTMNSRVIVTDVYILNFERERNNFIPNNISTFATEPEVYTPAQQLLDYMNVYVVESNCLYSYQYASKTWTRIYGIYGRTTVAQTYLPNGEAVVVDADDVTTNGILNDGSVVVRDANKMICGRLRSDGYTFYVNSLIGGQMNLEPSSTPSGNGCLQLNSESDSAYLNNDLVVFGNIKTVNKADWVKQYRLITEDVKLISYSLIKAGSTLKFGSVVNGTTYSSDTTITADITTEQTGMIITGSKLYVGSVVNNESLKPPYQFDINFTTVSAMPKFVVTDDVSVNSNVLTINIDSPFENVGDICFIKVNLSTVKVTTVKFKDGKEYQVESQAKDGISQSARIMYSFDGCVKILA